MKCFDIDSDNVSTGLRCDDLRGIIFGDKLLPFHVSLLNSGGDARFGTVLVDADLTEVLSEGGSEPALTAPSFLSSEALIRIKHCEKTGSTFGSKTSTTAVFESHGDASIILSGIEGAVYGGGSDFAYTDRRVWAVRIPKNAKMQLILVTHHSKKVIVCGMFPATSNWQTVRTVTYSFDGDTITVETTPEVVKQD